MTMPEHYYGIDLGDTKIELVACDASLQVRYRQRVPTPTQDFDALVRALVSLVHNPHVIVLLSQLPHLYSELAAAIRPHLIPGIGVPPILRPAFGDAGGPRGAALLARQSAEEAVC